MKMSSNNFMTTFRLNCATWRRYFLWIFYVMEHLVIHLPYEVLLGGPIHHWLMYPYGRSMKHLKGKAKNLAKVDGSIVDGSLMEETSHFTSYYFAPKICTLKNVPRKYDNGSVATTYEVDGVPDIFFPNRPHEWKNERGLLV